jgi:hypothetical protein
MPDFWPGQRLLHANIAGKKERKKDPPTYLEYLVDTCHDFCAGRKRSAIEGVMGNGTE